MCLITWAQGGVVVTLLVEPVGCVDAQAAEEGQRAGRQLEKHPEGAASEARRT